MVVHGLVFTNSEPIDLGGDEQAPTKGVGEEKKNEKLQSASHAREKQLVFGSAFDENKEKRGFVIISYPTAQAILWQLFHQQNNNYLFQMKLSLPKPRASAFNFINKGHHSF